MWGADMLHFWELVLSSNEIYARVEIWKEKKIVENKIKKKLN